MTAEHRSVPCLAIELPAIPSSVTTVRRRAHAFAARHGASGGTLDSIAMAVTEAVNNVVRHAYRGTAGDVQVLLDVEDGELEVVVTDDGLGFSTKPVHGLGVGLMVMREVSDAFEIRDRLLGGVEVWMRFALTA